jgi:hypothetical protein
VGQLLHAGAHHLQAGRRERIVRHREAVDVAPQHQAGPLRPA